MLFVGSVGERIRATTARVLAVEGAQSIDVRH